MAKGKVRSGDVACGAEKRLWGHIRLISDHGGRAGALLRSEVAKNVSNSNSHKYILLKRSYSISYIRWICRIKVEKHGRTLSLLWL